MNTFHIGHKRYQEIRNLGAGSFGSVVLARDTETNEQVAIKCLARGPKIEKHVLNEILNINRLSYPHVIEFKECFLTEELLCIVMEYAPGGNLRTFLKRHQRLDESMARWLFQQLILTLDYCHKMGVMNRDIKLENVLLDSSDPWPLLKMCDFGFSKHDRFNSAPHSLVGTRLYVAPEILQKQPHEEYDGMKADIWSCGVLLYIMVFNCYPFITKDDVGLPDSSQRIQQKIINSPLHFRGDRRSSPAVKDLLLKMLEKDPEKRLSVEEIMKHIWFSHHLPKGAFEMNKDIEEDEERPQSEEEIKRLVEEAKIPFDVEDRIYETL